jgi:hypothetical protein
MEERAINRQAARAGSGEGVFASSPPLKPEPASPDTPPSADLHLTPAPCRPRIR